MSTPTGRFNLRTRKSLKNQLECVSCKRHYFPLESSDDDETTTQTANFCCDCDEKQQTEPKSKRRAISIKVEKPDTNADDQCQTYQLNATYKSGLSSGIVVQIHSNELLQPPTLITNVTNTPRVAKIKGEQLDTTPKEVMKSGKANRALKNKTNTMETNNDTDTVHVKQENMITKNDTAETLREKFPDVNPYEFEFLLFLKTKFD